MSLNVLCDIVQHNGPTIIGVKLQKAIAFCDHAQKERLKNLNPHSQHVTLKVSIIKLVIINIRRWLQFGQMIHFTSSLTLMKDIYWQKIRSFSAQTVLDSIFLGKAHIASL